jgi:hypothetical protein
VGKVNPSERDKTAVHPIWNDSCGLFAMTTDWADDTSPTEKKHKKQSLIEVSHRLGAIVGPDGGTYINEANP